MFKMLKIPVWTGVFLCLSVFAPAEENGSYLDMSRQLLECVKSINSSLENVTDEKTSLEVKENVEKLAEKYLELVQKLSVPDPPASPDEVREYLSLKKEMDEACAQFNTTKQRLRNTANIHRSLESILAKLEKKPFR